MLVKKYKKRVDCSILTEDFLKIEYIKNQKSTLAIARQINCDRSVIVRRLNKFGIKSRNKSEAGFLRPPHTKETRNKIGIKSKEKQMPESFKILMSSRWTGIKNPNWNGGITAGNYQIRNFKNRWKSSQWADAIKSRDGNCKFCKSNDKLHAHHIKSWKKYPELRFDLDNGITLCKKCHNNLHRTKSSVMLEATCF